MLQEGFAVCRFNVKDCGGVGLQIFFGFKPIHPHEGAIAIQQFSFNGRKVNAGEVSFEKGLVLPGGVGGNLGLGFKESEDHAKSHKIFGQVPHHAADVGHDVERIQNVAQREYQSPGNKRQRGGQDTRSQPSEMTPIERARNREEGKQIYRQAIIGTLMGRLPGSPAARRNQQKADYGRIGTFPAIVRICPGNGSNDANQQQGWENPFIFMCP